MEQCNWECSKQSEINMTNITVKNYTVVYMCMEIMMCQYQMSLKCLWYLKHIGYRGHENALHRRSHMEESLLAFRVTSAKPFLPTIQYSKPPKVIEIQTLHISVFVNMTNIIVQNCAGQYMCMDVIICQSERSPEILMISDIHTILSILGCQPWWHNGIVLGLCVRGCRFETDQSQNWGSLGWVLPCFKLTRLHPTQV